MHKSHNTSLLPPKKICIGIVLDYSWDKFMFQEKLQTMSMQNLGGYCASSDLRKMHLKFLTWWIKYLISQTVGEGGGDWITGEGMWWLFYFLKHFRNCRKCSFFRRERNEPMMVNRQSNYTNRVVHFFLQIYYKVSLICVKINLHFWSVMFYSKQPHLEVNSARLFHNVLTSVQRS